MFIMRNEKLRMALRAGKFIKAAERHNNFSFFISNFSFYKLISSVAAFASPFGNFARNASTCSGQRPM